MTIAKLRGGPAGSVDYYLGVVYLGVVASGIEDYYAGHGEAPGRWLGSGATELGLAGTVDGADLRGVLEGRLPGVGLLYGADRERRTPGWDLTWSAPTSVSVLYGLTDAATSTQVVAALRPRSTPSSNISPGGVPVRDPADRRAHLGRSQAHRPSHHRRRI